MQPGGPEPLRTSKNFRRMAPGAKGKSQHARSSITSERGEQMEFTAGATQVHRRVAEPIVHSTLHPLHHPPSIPSSGRLIRHLLDHPRREHFAQRPAPAPRRRGVAQRPVGAHPAGAERRQPGAAKRDARPAWCGARNGAKNSKGVKF